MTEKSCLIGKYRKILNCCNFGIKWTYISLSCWKRVPLKMSNNSSRKFICSPVHSGKLLGLMDNAVKSQMVLEATNPNMFIHWSSSNHTDYKPVLFPIVCQAFRYHIIKLIITNYKKIGCNSVLRHHHFPQCSTEHI